MDLETAISRVQTLVAAEQRDPQSVSDEDIHAAMESLRQARRAAPAAKRGRTRAEPVDLNSVFG